MVRGAVQVEGLREFRRDVRRMDGEVGKELQRSLRSTAQSVARQAAAQAPRVTGTLATGYRGTARGTRGIVRNSVLYSRFIEVGFHPAGSRTFVQGRNVIGGALEARQDQIVEELGDAVDRAARRLGWR